MRVGVKSVLILSILITTGCGADIQSTLDAGEREVRPAVLALDEFRKRHESYPEKLDSLVDEGLLTTIPSPSQVSDDWDVYPPTYSLAPDGTFYMLSFAMDLPDGIGPGSIYTRYYISDERRWRTAKYPPRFDSLVADRSGRIYRDQKTFQSLETAVNRLVRSARIGLNCLNLYQSLVTDCLGSGEAIKIPAELQQVQDAGAAIYRSNDTLPSRVLCSFTSPSFYRP